jgi:hypothetical protein
MAIASPDSIDRALGSRSLTLGLAGVAVVLTLGAWGAPYPLFLLMPVLGIGLAATLVSRAWNLKGEHRLGGYAGGALSATIALTLFGYLAMAPYKTYTVEDTGYALVDGIMAEDHEALERLLPVYTGTAIQREQTAFLHKAFLGNEVQIVPSTSLDCALLTVNGMPAFELYMKRETPTVANRMQMHSILAMHPPKNEPLRSRLGREIPSLAAALFPETNREMPGGTCKVDLAATKRG